MTELEPIYVPPHVADYEAEHNLPMLVGTTRQISWARLIRHQLLRELAAYLPDATEGESAEDVTVSVAAVDWLRAEIDANHWIDHRDCRGDTKALITKITTEMDDQKRMEEQAKAEAAAILGSAAPEL